MAIIGFQFTKMNVEKQKQPSGKISVNNNITLIDLKEVNVIGSEKQKAIEFSFAYKTTYEPEIGKILLEGKLVYVGNEDKVKTAIELWEKEKKLLPEIIEEVYNHLFEKCSIQGLILAKEMGLPPQLPLPKVSAEKKEGVSENKDNNEKNSKKKKN